MDTYINEFVFYFNENYPSIYLKLIYSLSVHIISFPLFQIDFIEILYVTLKNNPTFSSITYFDK